MSDSDSSAIFLTSACPALAPKRQLIFCENPKGPSQNNICTLLQPEGARRRGAVCVVGAPRRCTAASPASRRLASGPSALAPKCKCYSVTGLNLLLSSTASLLGAIEPLRDPG